jgi:hypothetical protein
VWSKLYLSFLVPGKLFSTLPRMIFGVIAVINPSNPKTSGTPKNIERKV